MELENEGNFKCLKINVVEARTGKEDNVCITLNFSTSRFQAPLYRVFHTSPMMNLLRDAGSPLAGDPL